MIDTSWSLAVTPPRREFAAAKRLACLKFEHRLYSVRRRVALRGKVQEILSPAFPRYIFVAAKGHWHDLVAWSEIIGFVSFDAVAEVPQKIIEGLDASADDGVLRISEAPQCRFKRGDRVRISGPSLVSGYNGIFHSMLDDGKAIVLTEWMGRWVPTNVRNEDLFESKRKKRRRKRRRETLSS